MAAPASFSRLNGFIDRIGAIETPFSIEMPDGNKRYVWRRRRPRADPPQSGHRRCSHSHCSGRSRIQPSMIALTRDMVDIWSRLEARETSRRISRIWRLGRFLPEWAAQGAKAQIHGSARSVRQRAFGRPRRIPGGALHIRDQLHLVPGKLGEGQADHYIFPPVPCPVILAGGDLDDRNSRWQNRQTAMLARTRPGPAGARRTPGRALGRCGAIYTKPSYSPLDVALAASCILRFFS